MSGLINYHIEPEDIVIGKILGSGGFGKVFSCYKKNNENIKFAIKRIKKSKFENENREYLLNCFWTEIDCMKKCDCENSVKFINFYESENHFNIIMELCDSDLDKELKKHPKGFKIEEIQEILYQLNNAFKKLNDNNLIHRDLKLNNILIKYSSKSKLGFIPKLADFGFTKKLINKKTKTLVGTPGFTAPEILKEETYNFKADLWSLGSIIYQLYFCEFPYPPHKTLMLYSQNYKIKKTQNKQLDDLIDKLLLEDPDLRLNWDDYFIHPFFVGEKNNNQILDKTNNIIYNSKYKYLEDFYTGLDNPLYKCYIALDIENNKKVFIKSYFYEFAKMHIIYLFYECMLFKAFNGNKYILKINNIYRNSIGTHLVFDYIEGEILPAYLKYNNFSEKEIKDINYDLFTNIFKYNESNFKVFNFISIYSFMVTKEKKLILFDFGINKFALSFNNSELMSYYYPSLKEIGDSLYPMKTNVMNYGITLLKIFFGTKLDMKIKGKLLYLPNNKKMSDDFCCFLSNCLYINIRKRKSWNNLIKHSFISTNNTNNKERNNNNKNDNDNDVLLNNKKLKIIFDYLETKYDLINNYYSEIIQLNKKINYIEEIEIFLILTLFEQLIIIKLFDRDEKKHPFTFLQEISFMTINSESKSTRFNLNFANPILKNIKIINLSNNKLISDFIFSMKNKIKKLKEISIKIHQITKSNLVKKNYHEFLQNFINCLKSSQFNQYFFSLIPNFANKNKDDNRKIYKQLLIAEYICECILFVKEDLFESEKDSIAYDEKEYIKQFNNLFNDEKDNIVEISAIKLKEEKTKYILFSFLGSLYKYYKNSLDINNDSFLSNKNELDSLKRYYPNLLKKIISLKKEIDKQ